MFKTIGRNNRLFMLANFIGALSIGLSANFRTLFLADLGASPPEYFSKNTLTEESLSENTIRDALSPTHHALLFAWISKEVIERIGKEEGERIMRVAARRYGEQRGRRMALRARANRHRPTMANYLAYGEWEPGPDTAKEKQETIEKAPHLKVHVLQCPWHAAWKADDLLQYGRLYCQVIDEALVHGFNPKLILDVNSTLSNDAPYCEFVFHDANLTLFRSIALVYKQRVRPGNTAVMPWDYHLGHLWATVSGVVIQELGEAGYKAIEAAHATFTNRYGSEAATIVTSYKNTNFNCLP